MFDCIFDSLRSNFEMRVTVVHVIVALMGLSVVVCENAVTDKTESSNSTITEKDDPEMLTNQTLPPKNESKSKEENIHIQLARDISALEFIALQQRVIQAVYGKLES